MYPSLWQILLILLIVLLVFGPKRIPSIGKSLGEALRNFRKSMNEDKKEPEDQTKSEDQTPH